MSQRVVGYTGEGRSRRRIVVDEGPASVRVDREVGMGKASLIAGIPDRFAGAGEVERRQAYDAENDVRAEEARVARLSAVGPIHLKGDGEVATASRRRGGQVNAERLAARRSPEPHPWGPELNRRPATPPAPEEEPVSDSAPNPLTTLSEAAEAAADAHRAKLLADEAWEEARDAVAAAWAEVRDLVAPTDPDAALEELVEVAERAIDAGVAEAEASVALDGETQVSPVSEPGADHAETIPVADQPREARPLHDVETDWKRERWPGYLAPFITERCACGGSITAENLWKKIADAVHRHNESTRHTRWAVDNGWRHG